MAITLDTFTFPDGVIWQDRWEVKPIVGRHETLLTGRALFETAEIITGLPITIGTLPLNDGYAGLFNLQNVVEIKALYDDDDIERILTIDTSATYSVRFDRTNNQGLQVKQLVPVRAGMEWVERIYSVVARFRTTEPLS